MKNNFLLGLAIATTVLTSCGDDDVAPVVINDSSIVNNNDTVVNNNGSTTTSTTNQEESIDLEGIQKKDLVLKKGMTYNLLDALSMQSGTKLIIEEGVTIKARKGSGVYIAIEQGAKIMAEGTAQAPIVMTSNESQPAAGDWGGLIILGKAPINSVKNLDKETSTSEIASLPYGGNDKEDNSGVLKYVRVEYSGGKVDGQSENNGFSFYGVGNGTTIEYIQMYEGLDDGVEFFGGTVDVNYVSVVNSQDDSIDWTEGYKGTITNAYVKQNAGGDKAFECDGYNTDIGNNSDPKIFSSPTITNVTIEGLGSGEGKEAIRLRAGTEAKFENVVIKGYKEAFDIDGNDSVNPTAQNVVDGKLKATNVKLEDVTVKVKKESDVTYTDADFLTEGDASGTNYATWGAGWTKK